MHFSVDRVHNVATFTHAATLPGGRPVEASLVDSAAELADVHCPFVRFAVAGPCDSESGPLKPHTGKTDTGRFRKTAQVALGSIKL